MYIIPAHCRRVVAGQAERTALASDGEGIGAAGRVVAAFTLPALDRGMDRGGQKTGGIGGMYGMAGGALTLRHGITSVSLDEWLRGGIMAIPAQLFFLFDQEMLLIAAVNRMTGETSLLQRLMLMRPGERLLVMATIAGFRGRGGEHSGGIASVRIVADGAASLPRRIMQIGFVKTQGGLVVANIAECRSLVFQSQHADYAMRLVARQALFLLKRSMLDRSRKLGQVMTAKAVPGGVKPLPFLYLGQAALRRHDDQQRDREGQYQRCGAMRKRFPHLRLTSPCPPSQSTDQSQIGGRR